MLFPNYFLRVYEALVHFLSCQRALKSLLPKSECSNISPRRKAARVGFYASSWDKQLRAKFPVPAAGRIRGFGPVLYHIKCGNSNVRLKPRLKPKTLISQTKTKDSHLSLTFFSIKNSASWAIKFGLYTASLVAFQLENECIISLWMSLIGYHPQL